jgi:hypothetical protein
VQISPNYGGTDANEEVMTVYPPVSKVDFISFLVAYIKCIDPTLKSLIFCSAENTLKLGFLNRKG